MSAVVPDCLFSPFRDRLNDNDCTSATLVGGHQVGTQRVEGLARLPLDPLATALELERPFGHVVGDRVAGHDVERGVLVREVAALGTDHDGELHLPVGLLAAAGDTHVVVGAHHGVGSLEEDDRLARSGQTRLRCMVAVVQAHADDLPRAGHAGPDALRVHVDDGELLGPDGGAQPGQPVVREEVSGVVADLARDVHHRAVLAQHARTFLTRGSHSKQSHVNSPNAVGVACLSLSAPSHETTARLSPGCGVDLFGV